MHADIYTVFLLYERDKTVVIVAGMGYFEESSTNKPGGKRIVRSIGIISIL